MHTRLSSIRRPRMLRSDHEPMQLDYLMRTQTIRLALQTSERENQEIRLSVHFSIFSDVN